MRAPTTWDQLLIDNLRSSGQYTVAVTVLEPLYAEQLRTRGGADAETILTGHWLALVYADSDRLDDAIRIGQEVLGWSRQTHGPEDLDTLTTQGNLAIDLYSAGRYDESYSLLKTTFDARTRVIGADDADSLWTGHWLALVAAQVGQLDEAITVGRYVLDGETRVLGAESDRTLSTGCNLGIDLYNADRIDEAITVLEPAFALRRTRQPDGAQTWWAGHYLALAYADADRLEDAIRVDGDVLAARTRIFGEEDPSTVTTATNLGAHYLSAGRPDDAIATLKRVCDLGLEHGRAQEPATLLAGHWLAAATAASGRLPEAISLARVVLAGRREALGPEHLETLTTASNLGTYLEEDDPPDDDEAQELAERREAVTVLEPTYDARVRILGVDNRDTLRTGAVLARAYADVGRLVDATRLGRTVLAAQQKVLGAEDPETLVTASNLGTHLVQQGDPASAVPILEQAFEARSRVLGAEHSHTLLTGHWLAEAYDGAGRTADAGPATARQVLDARRRMFGADFPAVERTMKLLSRLEENESTAPTEGAGAPAAPSAASPLDAALAELDALRGLAAAKAEIRGIVAVVQFNARREAAGKKVRRPSHHMVFVGNPGTGKTTVARIVGRIFAALGTVKGGQLIEAAEADLVEGYIGQTAPKTTRVFQSAIGGVLFIDEAYSLARREDGFGREAIDTIVKLMEDHREEVVVIVAGYPDLMADFLRANPGLPSRFNTTVTFENYSTDDLVEIFRAQCRDAEFSATPEVEKRVRDFLDRVPRGRDFGNAREVRNLLDTAIKRHAVLRPGDLDVLDPDDVPERPGAVDEGTRPSVDELLGQLNAMTGLASIKDRVRQIASSIEWDTERRKQGLPVDPTTIHFVFGGNPGTGKTTVARMLAGIFASIGVLARGHVVEVSRTHLVAEYEGQTAPKTTKAFESAAGGVLFVDEAYTLTRRGDQDPFGREAVDVLNKLMEDRRDVAVIAAGYTDLMAEFLAANPGLASRFEETIVFPDYTNDELVAIFSGICASHRYEVSAEVVKAVRRYFEAQPRGTTFGNGRLARSLFEAADDRHGARVLAAGEPSQADFTTLQVEDIPSLS